MSQNARIRYYTRKELRAIFIIVRYKEMKTFFFLKKRKFQSEKMHLCIHTGGACLTTQ